MNTVVFSFRKYCLLSSFKCVNFSSCYLHFSRVLTKNTLYSGSIFLKNNSISFKRHFCSSTHIVQMRGLDFEATEQDVIDFFKPLYITPMKIQLRCDISGRVTGLCEVEFASHADAVVAMRKKTAFIGNRFIRLSLKSTPDDSQSYKNINSEKYEETSYEHEKLPKGNYATGHFVRMKNLPSRVTEQAIFKFFWPLNIRPVSVSPVYDGNENRTGEFDVEFLTQEDAVKALSKNNTYMGHRIIELALCSPSISSKPYQEMNDVHCQTGAVQ